jgi:LmbE family N-acetylglucosaminyl deacetylase
MSVLVVAAHADDEVIGMGGTIAGLTARGVPVACLFLGDGVTSRPGAGEPERRLRRQATEAACATLGATIAGRHDLPDNRFDSVALLDIVRLVEEAIARLRPQTVFTHHAGDLNIDHVLTARAVLTACRPRPGQPVQSLYAFRVLSSSEWSHATHAPPFLPDTFVETTAHLDRQLAAYACYGGEAPPDPHARSAEALRLSAAAAGRIIGVPAAEGFITLRRIIAAGASFP